MAVSAVVAVREEVQLATIAVVTPPAPEPVVDAVSACVETLVTRWEVGGQKLYTRKWQGVIWPGGASGPTWGIGYDGGHQTRLDIVRDWAEHEARSQLATTSGVTGRVAQARLPEWAGIRTPYPFAAEIFKKVSAPQYAASARRALGPGFVSLPSGTQCALISLGYNRGWSMGGSRRVEMATIRDQCVPQQSPQCVAAQLRSMKRLWPTVPGLQNRREDEARVAEGTKVVGSQPSSPPASRIQPPTRPAPQPRDA
jgi:hypothetical protein